ncbi:hepatocyte growth factor-regulated tyrosine kinase substrate [Galendromus occidentalis]|uniref:Hepatocyte growth factor-regulated tyrosine kinase substrate n=1 Tax=Galendromus occidentalis TaxID=34638 RepID=A0AAJ7SGP9_9ACAR|nr:hepatocyte growth factor-regulated tyrosine kinase substrate [Galendromus occidentalis]
MFSWSGGNNFGVLLERATSTQLLEPDWMVIIEMCDSIRSGESDPKVALALVKKKLTSKNPNVTMLALHCLESMVKNCGHPIHKEVATQAFMEDFRGLLRLHESEVVRDKILELIQTWAHAFRKEPAYRAVQDLMTFMRVEGVKFPQLKESDAMFAAQVPPEWEDSDCCHLCRTQFTTFNRKHHCRKCGQVFCAKCSSQTSALPKLGIEKKVRVCDTCFLEVNPESSSHSSPEQAAKEAKLKEDKLREEEEFQLALALSQSEAEFKSQKTYGNYSSSTYESESRAEDRGPSLSGAQAGSRYPPPESIEANAPTRSECGSTTGSTESELTHYLDRKYWDERSNRVGDTDTPKHTVKPLDALPQSTESDDQFEQLLEKSLDNFVNRLRSNEMRGRPIANDTYLQSLFMQISSLHARLLQAVQETDDQRAYYEGLQDKMQQIRDARAALDALREEHREEERKRQEEAERTRQLQMAHKLEIMRQRKHEYLQYQHQMAMMKMQEQEMQYRTGGVPAMLPPMGMLPQQLPGQPPMYNPQAQYPPGVTMLPPGALPPGAMPQGALPPGAIPAGAIPPGAMPQGPIMQGLPPGQAYPPPPQQQQQQQQPPMSPPHTIAGPQVTQYYAPNHMHQNYGPPQQVPSQPEHHQPQQQVVNHAPQQMQGPVDHDPQQLQQQVLPQVNQQISNHQPAHGHVPQQVHGPGQPAFEPYGVNQMLASMPTVPQTPLPQPCAPPQTPTPNHQEVLNLPAVPTHEPGPAVVHPPEAQLISFD